MIINKIFTYFFTYFLLTLSFPIPLKAEEIKPLINNSICANNLETEIDKIIHQPSREKETWGIVIESLNPQKIFYELNRDKFFIPASNVKLLITASILIKKGANFSIITPIYTEGNSPNLSSLIIEGKSDPSFTNDHLKLIADSLKTQQVTTIDNLILVNNSLPNNTTNYTWEFEDIYFDFAVPVNNFILNQNTVNLTLNHSFINQKPSLIWSDEIAGKQWLIDNQVLTSHENTPLNLNIYPLFARSSFMIMGELPLNEKAPIWRLSIPNPDQYFQESLVKILQENGIKIIKSEVINDTHFKDKNLQLLLEIKSPSLAELITITNQDSNNLYAEVLLKNLADDSHNSWQSLETILNQLGVSPDEYKLKDGSGLSRHNLITPHALITLLKAMANNDVFINSLSNAGVNGSLKNRFLNTNISNNLFAKTGTLSGISALSGYLKNDDYGNLVFSILVNQSSSDSATLRRTIDEIVLLLGQLKKCE